MDVAAASARILLVDDGELEGVARVLEGLELPYERLRGGQIPQEVAPPRDLLIVTPRRIERVRRGSPPESAPGRPLRIIAVDEDSPAMRRQLRRAGLHLLVRLPAEDEIWRLLVSRALYEGRERREDPRVTVGSPVEVESGGEVARDAASAARKTILIDLSNRGCRLRTTETVSIGDPVAFSIPTERAEESGSPEGLSLRGRVRRLVCEPGTSERTLAVVFDNDLPEPTRTRLTALINRWASGPGSTERVAEPTPGPAIPACQLPSLPDLTLDDETDPPVHAGNEVCVELQRAGDGSEAADRRESHEGTNRRRHSRARFESAFLAEAPTGPVVMIGRDLSAGGMRIERIEEFQPGDRFRLALHGPGPGEPFVVEAEVVRDEGPEGFALAFRGLDRETAAALEKLVACLPDVESLEDGEAAGLGAILSEVLSA
jgi:hypothetical protein